MTVAIRTGTSQRQSQHSFAHNTEVMNNNNNPCLRSSEPAPITAHSTSNSETATSDSNDPCPLEQLETIEVVKQSDTTLDIDAEDDSNVHNISNWSLPPIRNLMGAFEDMKDMKEEELLLSTENRLNITNSNTADSQSSPNGVEQYDENTGGIGLPIKPKPTAPKVVKSISAFPLFKIDMPRLDLYGSLQLKLSQPVVDRCSFYSVIHGVNKEVLDMATQDLNVKSEEPKDLGSALVRAVNGPTKQNIMKPTSQVDLAVLDEEKFLLAAISSRSNEEMAIRACPASFAEAIGEVDAMISHDNGFAKNHSENPLSVLASSRTQLWKPSRSWWEAKSGKNPWIEPHLHNKRWRYLWPLIHYHKFLAKCIKKLKRNNVDVKTSLSPVSAFLREEVCAVSDHLASVSKFDSEEWMDGLQNFHGWTSANPEKEQLLREIINTLPMRTIIEPKDVDSPLLRDQIDQSFLKAMAAEKSQLASGADAYQRETYGENSAPNRRPSYSHEDTKRNPTKPGSRPPRPNLRGGRNSNRVPNGRKNFGGRQSRRQQPRNGYMGMNHMVPQQMHHGMYYGGPYQGGQMSGHYMPPHPENEYYYGGWVQQPLPNVAEYDNTNYGGGEFSNAEQYYAPHHNGNMHSNGNMHPNGNWSQCPPTTDQEGAASVCSDRQANDDASQYSDQGMCEPESVSLSFIGPKVSNPVVTCKTPSKQTPLKERTNSSITPGPPSPYWGHLTGLAMSGLATPVDGRLSHSPHYGFEHSGPSHGNNAHVKPLLINNYSHIRQPGHVPPSPATQFLMSPQANPQHHAYFAHGNVVHGYSSPSPAKPMQSSFPSSGNISSNDESSSATTEVSSMEGRNTAASIDQSNEIPANGE